MLLAIKDRASDIHFEPFEDEYKLRYRCDGVMYEMVPPPRHLANAISTRIKVMANLDIAERRLPQDGRIELNVGGNRGRHARQHPAHHVRRKRPSSACSTGQRRPRPQPHRHGAEDARRLPRADPEAQRHRAGHRADRLGQDHHALFRLQRAQRHHREDHHHARTRSSTTSTASSRCRSMPKSASRSPRPCVPSCGRTRT